MWGSAGEKAWQPAFSDLSWEKGGGCVPQCHVLTSSVLSPTEVIPILSLSGFRWSEAASGLSPSLVKFSALRSAKSFTTLLSIFHCVLLLSPPFSFSSSFWDYEYFSHRFSASILRERWKIRWKYHFLNLVFPLYTLKNLWKANCMPGIYLSSSSLIGNNNIVPISWDYLEE